MSVNAYTAFTLALTFVVLFTQISIGYAAVNETQVLVDFYNELGGADWTSADDWLSPSVDKCEWEGVTCDAMSRIKGLNLGWNNLVGDLPGLLANFTQLLTLDLQFNSLGGSLEQANLSALTKLEKIDLSENLITGAIPEYICGFLSLNELNIDGNSLSSPIPSCLANLTTLDHVDLSNNLFNEDLPTFLGEMPSVSVLSLSGNNFKGDISRVNWSKIGDTLQYLDISYSSVTCEDNLDSLSDLHNIIRFVIVEAKLECNVTSFFESATDTLTHIHLDGNRLCGFLPSRLIELPALESLNLENNNLSGVVPSLLLVRGLKDVLLANNDFEGTLPSNVTILNKLSLGGNHFSCPLVDIPYYRGIYCYCPPGQGSDYYNINCTLCSPGSSASGLSGNSINGSTEARCKECQIETYADQYGMSNCLSCPLMSVSFYSGGSSCTYIPLIVSLIIAHLGVIIAVIIVLFAVIFTYVFTRMRSKHKVRKSLTESFLDNAYDEEPDSVQFFNKTGSGEMINRIEIEHD